MEARSSGLFPTSATDPRRAPARRRPLLLPVAGSASAAAAAAAIFAVVAGGGLPGAADPAPTGSVTVDVAGQVGPLTTSPPTGTTPPPATSSPTPTSSSGPSSTGTGTPSSTAPATTTPRTSTAPTSRATSRPGTAPTSRAGAASTAGAPGAGSGATTAGSAASSASSKAASSSTADAAQQITTTEFSGAGRDATITVQAAGAGTHVQLGGQDGYWLVASANQSGSPAISTGNNNFVGPLQQGNSNTVGSGPFSVDWQNGSGSGTTGSWLLAPPASEDPGLFRLPVRFRTSPAKITLYVGTVSGRGRITVTLNGTASGTKSVDLPSCSSTCASIVTIEVSPSAGTTAAAGGDLMVDLSALDSGGRIGLAAATLR